MAYINQQEKKEIAEALKKELGSAKERGFKYSLGVRNLSTLVIKISSGSVDFMGNYNEKRKSRGLDERKYASFFGACRSDYSDSFSGDVAKIINKIAKIMNKDNHDNSDSMTDYFDVGYYVDIRIGDYDKPYKLEV
jgi:hypothetical protein